MVDTPVYKIGSDTAAIVAGTVGGVQYRYEMPCDLIETVNSDNRNTTADSLPFLRPATITISTRFTPTVSISNEFATL